MAPRPRCALSLCAGGGGLDMGLGLAEPGFATACYVEIEPEPRAVLEAAQAAGYFHPAPIWDDIKRFSGIPWRGIVDTLIAGYPCQPFSQAGQRRGEDDPRHLFPHVARIARELGPGLRYIFLENVAGHVTLGGETVLRTLWDMGFTPATGLFSAEEVGAPHERLRWFCVAYRSGIGEREPDDAQRTEPRRDAWRCSRGRGGGYDGEVDDAKGRGRSVHARSRSTRVGEADVGRSSAVDDAHTDANARRPVRRGDRSIPSEGQGNLGSGQRVWSEPGCSGGPVDNPTGPRCDRAWIRSGADIGGWQRLFGEGCDELADAGEPRSQGREFFGPFGEWDRSETLGPAPQLCGPRLHPPGPGDREAWADVLERAGDMAPALSLREVHAWWRRSASTCGEGGPEADPSLCRMADGLAERSRALSILGNGVHPMAAAYAWRTLAFAHGLRPLDLEAAGDAGRAPAIDAVFAQ